MTKQITYSVVHFPSNEVTQFALRYRRPYLASFPVNIAPHFTILTPFESRRSKEELCEAIQAACAKIEPFSAVITGFDFFTNDKFVVFMKLADERKMHQLQEEIDLAIPEIDWRDVLRPGVRARPHLSVGFFETREELEAALQRLQGIKLDLRWSVRSVDLLAEHKEDRPETAFTFILGRSSPLAIK